MLSAYFHAGIGYLLGSAVLALFGACALARLGITSHRVPRWLSASVLVVWVAVASVLVVSDGWLSRTLGSFSWHSLRSPDNQAEPTKTLALMIGRQLPTESRPTSKLGEPVVYSELVHDLLSGGKKWADAESAQLVDCAVETLAGLPEPDQTQGFEANGADDWKYRLAAERLLLIGGKAAPEQLRTSLEHSHPNVRAAAALTLALLGDQAAIPQLRDRLKSETVYPVRCALAESILELSDPDEIESVRMLAQSLPEETPRRLLAVAARRDASFWAASDKTMRLWTCPTQPDLWQPIQVGDTLHDLLVCDVNGQPIQLSEAASHGRLLISFVTGDHCYMCDMFLNGILKPEAERATNSETVLLVLPHTPLRTRAYANQFGLLQPDAAIRVVADPQAELAARFGIARQYVLHSEWCNPPAAFLLDDQLTLRWFHVGKTVMDRATVFPKDP